MARLSRHAPWAVVLVLLALLWRPLLALGQQPDPCPGLPDPTVPSWNLDQHPELAAMAPTIQSILEQARVRYQSPRGVVDGYTAGITYRYPGGAVPFYIFARDTATILPMARYFAGDSVLRSAVEEFARLQYTRSTVSVDGDLGLLVGPGALSGTISPDFQVDKATETSDEEASIILAAVLAYRLHADAAWLATPIAGQPLLDRLNLAMDWLLTHRLDPDAGLIKRGHTTDWGDVKMEPAPQPTDIGPDHVWTYSIYDQAIVFAALRGLAELNVAAGRLDTARRYLDQSRALREAATERLWQPGRGYFRIHLHASYTPEPHPFDEDAIVAIGNAAALYYGLATGDQAQPIVLSLEAARLRAGAPKAGLTLDPPYPDGTFLQVQMAERNYQNGALWDWWAGRQISAEYRSGFSRYGDAHLLQLAADWAQHPGSVYEWESPWTSRRSKDDRYTGAAAVVGEAIVSGLFGITLDRFALDLAPRLATRGGAIGLTDVPSGTQVAYRYTFDPAASRAELCYRTSFRGPITLRPLLPPRMHLKRASLDGAPLPARQQVVQEDRYALIDGAPGAHRLTLELEPSADAR